MYKLLKNSLGVTDSSYTNTRAELSLEVGRVVSHWGRVVSHWGRVVSHWGRVVSHWGRVVLGRVVCPPNKLTLYGVVEPFCSSTLSFFVHLQHDN